MWKGLLLAGNNAQSAGSCGLQATWSEWIRCERHADKVTVLSKEARGGKPGHRSSEDEFVSTGILLRLYSQLS